MLTADRTYEINGVKINEFLLTKRNPNNITLPKKRTKKLIGVTVHNTNDLENVNDDGEQYTRATYNGNMNDVRVHFYVDDICAWQNLPLDWQSWHAGQKGKIDANGSEAGNAQTISIECIMNGTTGSANEKAEDNCARLVAYLLHNNGLTIDNLYTHNYWCNVRKGLKGSVDYLNKTNDGYKNCPVFIRPHWDKFKSAVEGYMKKLDGTDNKVSATVPRVLYRVQVGAFSIKSNADAYLKKIKAAGFTDAFITKSELYRVQVGAFSIKSNADAYLKKIKAAGFTDAFITKSE